MQLTFMDNNSSFDDRVDSVESNIKVVDLEVPTNVKPILDKQLYSSTEK